MQTTKRKKIRKLSFREGADEIIRNNFKIVLKRDQFLGKPNAEGLITEL
jgi:hypothetical protein